MALEMWRRTRPTTHAPRLRNPATASTVYITVRNHSQCWVRLFERAGWGEGGRWNHDFCLNSKKSHCLELNLIDSKYLLVLFICFASNHFVYLFIYFLTLKHLVLITNLRCNLRGSVLNSLFRRSSHIQILCDIITCFSWKHTYFSVAKYLMRFC